MQEPDNNILYPLVLVLAPVLFGLLFLFFSFSLGGCAGPGQTQAAQKPEGMAVNEQEGDVFREELEVYSSLESRGIMIPDSVVVIEADIFHGYVDRIGAPRTVHLGTLREGYPSVDIPEGYPYLFARNASPDESLFRKYVAVHELAHVQAAHLNAEMGRPALGLDSKSGEVQADILALVYLNHLYGTTREDLGYPAEVNYPMIPNKSVRSLQRLYCHIVKETWDVTRMDCERSRR